MVKRQPFTPTAHSSYTKEANYSLLVTFITNLELTVISSHFMVDDLIIISLENSFLECLVVGTYVRSRALLHGSKPLACLNAYRGRKGIKSNRLLNLFTNYSKPRLSHWWIKCPFSMQAQRIKQLCRSRQCLWGFKICLKIIYDKSENLSYFFQFVVLKESLLVRAMWRCSIWSCFIMSYTFVVCLLVFGVNGLIKMQVQFFGTSC